MSFGQHDHPFYRPLRVRLAIIAATAIWAGMEVLYAKEGFWTVIAVAVFAYCLWAFLLNWKTPPAAP